MSQRISGTVPRMPAAAGPGPAQAEASHAAPPAPPAPTPGGLARRSARGQEQANHQLRQAMMTKKAHTPRCIDGIAEMPAARIASRAWNAFLR